MRSSSTRRSTSVTRPAAGKRSTTPSSRRQSDVHERPAWDATSNNLEKYKLTTEELERRKAARVSKNRVLSSDAKSSFVQAWANNVANSVMSGDADPHDDQEPDNPTPHQSTGEDRRAQGRTNPSPALPIDYSSALQLMRKSPGGLGSGQRPSSTPPMSEHGGRSGGDHTSAETSRGGASGEGPGLEATLADATGTRAAVEGLVPGGGAREVWGSSAPGALPVGSRGGGVLDARAGGTGSGVGEGKRAEQQQQQQGTELRRAELSITPVTAASRPRFNAAEATTIISYEDGSDGEEDGRVSEVREGDEEEDRDSEGQEGDEDSGSAASPSPAKGPRPHARGAVVGGQAAAASRRATEAAATAAFEAALFGRAVAGHGGKAKGAAVGLPAWSAEQEASPARMGAATGDVELRLRALEAAVGRAGAGGAAAEEVADLRAELRRVQEDNARLRQELSAFSSHASTLMTQLQAQVNQLLRSTPSQHGPNLLAGLTSSTTAAQASAPYAASSAAPAAGPASQFSSRPFQPLPDPHQPGPAAHLHPHGAQPSVSRRIFTDLDDPVPTARSVPAAWLAPTASPWGGGPGAATQGGSQAPGLAGPAVSVPSWLAGSDGGGVRMGMGPGPVGVGAAVSVTAAPQPPPGLAVPVSVVDDVDVALPSFAAFRRSAGTSAFTAARPTPGLDRSTAPSPSPSTTLDPPHSYTFAAAPTRTSPATAVLGTTTNNTAPHLGPQLQQPAASVVHQRAFPTQYQPRSLGGVLTQAGVGGGGNNVVLVPGLSASAAMASSLHPTSTTSPGFSSGAPQHAPLSNANYAAAIAASASRAVNTRSDAAAVELARMHAGMPQPLVFSVGGEVRHAAVRAGGKGKGGATGLGAENSMSLSAHTAAAAALKAKSSSVVGGSR